MTVCPPLAPDRQRQFERAAELVAGTSIIAPMGKPFEPNPLIQSSNEQVARTPVRGRTFLKLLQGNLAAAGGLALS
jgi:hypothetical protein